MQTKADVLSVMVFPADGASPPQLRMFPLRTWQNTPAVLLIFDPFLGMVKGGTCWYI